MLQALNPDLGMASGQELEVLRIGRQDVRSAGRERLDRSGVENQALGDAGAGHARRTLLNLRSFLS